VLIFIKAVKFQCTFEGDSHFQVIKKIYVENCAYIGLDFFLPFVMLFPGKKYGVFDITEIADGIL
jgi:hypothetical protein